jgi:hypothetical protein
MGVFWAYVLDFFGLGGLVRKQVPQRDAFDIRPRRVL